jgi:hypothetical protein
MTIALRSQQTAFSNTLTMPTHSTGDLLLAFATRDNNATPPTLPTGWDALFSIGSGTGAVLMGYKYAQSNSETFGTWTNATHVAAFAWYGAANTIVWPWLLSTNTATSGTMTWLAQTTGTFRTGSEDNVLVAWGHNRSITNNLAQTLGALTNTFIDSDGASYQVGVKHQLARTTAWTSTSLAMATSVFYRTAMLCLTEQTGYGFTGGSSGGFRQVNIRGGADQ